MPLCPHFRLIICISNVYLGAHMPKSVPPMCPLGAPQKKSTKAFAYTQTVVWAYANGCLGIRKQLFGRTQTVITRSLTPCFLPPFSQFGGTCSSRTSCQRRRYCFGKRQSRVLTPPLTPPLHGRGMSKGNIQTDSVLLHFIVAFWFFL